MRLIDADKLKVAHGVFCPRVEGSKEIYSMPEDAVFADEIESAPTVEAVPIEYMQSQVDCGKWEEIIQRWREHGN